MMVLHGTIIPPADGFSDLGMRYIWYRNEECDGKVHPTISKGWNNIMFR
jgi:hypothetical protein